MSEFITSIEIRSQVDAAFPDQRAALAGLKRDLGVLQDAREAFVASHSLAECRDYDVRVADLRLAVEHAQSRLSQAETAMFDDLTGKDRDRRAHAYHVKRIIYTHLSAAIHLEYGHGVEKVIAAVQGLDFLRSLAAEINNEKPADLPDLPTYNGVFSEVARDLYLPDLEGGGPIWSRRRQLKRFEEGHDPANDLIKSATELAVVTIKALPTAELATFAVDPQVDDDPFASAVSPDADADRARPDGGGSLLKRAATILRGLTARAA